MRFLLLAVLCLFSVPANANIYYIDLDTIAPIGTLSGPCYCGRGPLWEIAANPGDVFDFGSVTLHGGFLGITPDGGSNQPTNRYFNPDVSVSFGTIIGGGYISGTPDTSTRQLGLYTIPDDAHLIRIGWMGTANTSLRSHPPYPSQQHGCCCCWVLSLLRSKYITSRYSIRARHRPGSGSLSGFDSSPGIVPTATIRHCRNVPGRLFSPLLTVKAVLASA